MGEHALKRAWQVLRREGVRSFWFRLIGELGYRRLYLLERSLAVPLPSLPCPLPLEMSWLQSSEVDEYLRLRQSVTPSSVGERLAQGCRCLMVRAEGRLVGVMWACTQRASISYLDHELPLAAGEVYTFDAYIEPSFRGQAIAPSLSIELLRRFREAGCQRAIRATLPENRAALRAHAKAGFNIFAVIRRLKIGPCCHTFLELDRR